MLIEPVGGDSVKDDAIEILANSFSSYIERSKLLKGF